MKTIALIAVSILMAAQAEAKGPRRLTDIDRELSQAKSTATIQALVEDLAEAEPQTDEDMAALVRLLDKYPEQGRKAVARAKHPKLAKALMSECGRQAGRVKELRAKTKVDLTAMERGEYLERLANSESLMRAAAELKNKEAIPMLRSYLGDPDLSRPASIALGRLGDEESLNEMLSNVEELGNVDLSGYGDKAFAKIVRELDKPGLKTKRKSALLQQIKGGRSHERKRALKELALKHPDEDVRERSSLALVNSISDNPEESDADFLYAWAPKAISDFDAVWSLLALRLHFPDKNRPLESRFIPVLIEILNKSRFSSARGSAAELLGKCNVPEALPHLKKCIVEDKERGVRGRCSFSYFTLTGEVPAVFHPVDANELEERQNEKSTVEFYEKRSDTDTGKKFYLARLKALEEYKRNQAQDQK